MNIDFHCDESTNFRRHDQYVRTVTYTEYSIGPHNHDFYEMNIVLNGTGVHQIEDKRFPVKKGDVFVIPPMTVHAYFDTKHLEIYHILFKNEFIKKNESEASKVPGFLKLMEIVPFLRQNCADAMFLHLTPSQSIEIQRDLKFIEDKSEFNDARLLPLHEHTAWKIIYHLSYLLEKQIEDESNYTTEKYRHQIIDTLEYLNSHFSKKITVKELAERVYLSRSTFLRSFNAVCGCPPMEYLNQYRVQKAAELLKNSGLSKTEIAHSCGFYDLSHMEKNIKKMRRNVRL